MLAIEFRLYRKRDAGDVEDVNFDASRDFEFTPDFGGKGISSIAIAWKPPLALSACSTQAAKAWSFGKRGLASDTRHLPLNGAGAAWAVLSQPPHGS